jgi:3-isopropylmalate/(R)-2-methylmalate dehydratase small subunit
MEVNVNMDDIKGKVFKFGNNVDTDVIIPARYLNNSDPKQLAAHCMEDIDPGFPEKIRGGGIIVAGSNFGCGSSREHAPISIKAVGVSCIIAESFARIFFRNSINIGLAVLECPEAFKKVSEGDNLIVDTDTGLIRNLGSGETYKAVPYPGFISDIVKSGGLIEYASKMLTDKRRDCI